MKPSGILVSWCYQRFCMVHFNDRTGAPITTGIVVFLPTIISISISRSLYSGCFSVVFREVLLSVGSDVSMSWQVFFLVFHFETRPVDLNFFINLDSHVPNHSSFNVFVAVAGSLFIVFFFGFNDTLLTNCPVEVSCYFDMPFYSVFWCRQIFAFRYKMVSCFLILFGYPALWVGVVIQDFVSLVILLNTLVISSNN